MISVRMILWIKIIFCPNKWQCPQSRTLHFYPNVTLPGSAIDRITRLTEGNQPCSRHFLSSSVYPQDLWSPPMPKVLLLSWVNQPSPCFSSSYSSLSHPCASLHMLICWKGPKFSSLDVGRLCPSEHVCVLYLLQLSLPKQLHRAQHLLLIQGDMDWGNTKTRFKPRALSLCTAEPPSLQSLALDPDEDSVWTSLL